MIKKAIVISGVNLSEGGPLTIISSVLEFLDQSEYVQNYDIFALVHSKKLFKDLKHIQFLEYPEVKGSWLKRVFFEYSECLEISKKLNAYFWFSLHDASPNIVSCHRAVYCHNASPFYKQRWVKFFKSPLRFLYTKYYKELYRVNIRTNDYVVVQQQWMREEFVKWFRIDRKKIIVSIPGDPQDYTSLNLADVKKEDGLVTFFYPAFPREFKNFEVICKATQVLSRKNERPFQVILTMDGTENEYAEHIFKSYHTIENIKFAGLLSREEVEKYYRLTDCLIFPSVLESWGLPISEFKNYNKPMLIADLPYAYETVGGFEKVKFFSPEDEQELAADMSDLMNSRIQYNSKGPVHYDNPVSRNWEELFKILIP
ncbi:MAG: glycosyltransferase [Kaistella sp.]|nr:glycosyltransferase [Kaistella sp.]